MINQNKETTVYIKRDTYFLRLSIYKIHFVLKAFESKPLNTVLNNNSKTTLLHCSSDNSVSGT